VSTLKAAKAAATPPPIFIRANFKFHVLGQEFSFLNQAISVFGVSALKWSYFEPISRVGELVSISVDVLARERFKFTTTGSLMAEQTVDANMLSIRFHLQPQDKVKLEHAIAVEGFCPTSHMRKYPRIPAVQKISDMPLRAIAQVDDNDQMVFDIANLSPNGILLYTENPKGGIYLPGNRVRGQIEPRGSYADSIHFEGIVRRTFQERNLDSQNLAHYLGVRFSHIPPSQQDRFVDLLRSVLHDIKQLNRNS